MSYRVVFEYQNESGAMSDVYNCRDEQSAKEKFAELKEDLLFAIDPSTCEVIDEPMYYCLFNREEGIYGYVRLLED